MKSNIQKLYGILNIQIKLKNYNINHK